VQSQDGRPYDHCDQRRDDQQGDDRAAQVQDKDPQERQADSNDVFCRFAPGSVHDFSSNLERIIKLFLTQSREKK
jgi:hypothetical protein